MPSGDIKKRDYPVLSDLSDSKSRLHPQTNNLQERGLNLLTLKDRSLLKLLYYRGATQGELAGALGISRCTLRRMLRTARARATNPQNLAILLCWRRLTDEERHLVRLNCFMGVSLRRVAHDRLITMPAEPPACGGLYGAATFSQLRRMMRAVQRKARRSKQWRQC